MSNRDVRQWYNDNVKAIGDMVDKKLSLREQALEAFRLRNTIRQVARDMMADRVTAESLPPQPTFMQLVRHKYFNGSQKGSCLNNCG